MLKSYAIRLKFGNMFKDFYFEGDDSPECMEKWRQACMELEDIGDSCEAPVEFFEKAKRNFVSHGFIRVAK
jgi:hypothetical protein